MKMAPQEATLVNFSEGRVTSSEVVNINLVEKDDVIQVHMLKLHWIKISVCKFIFANANIYLLGFRAFLAIFLVFQRREIDFY